MAHAHRILLPACSLLALVAVQALAGDVATATRSPYRLAPNGAAAFRLGGVNLDHISRQVPARLAAKPYASQIQRAARKAALDPALVHALITVESAYDPAARSPKGALGLMQVMPQTAMRYGVRDPGRSTAINLRVGTRYLSDLIVMFDGRLDLALAAYNAGEQAVLRYARTIPPYPETRHYVEAVAAEYRALQGSGSARSIGRSDYLRGTRLNRDGLRAEAPAAIGALRN